MNKPLKNQETIYRNILNIYAIPFMYSIYDFICINEKIWGIYEDDLCAQ